MHRHRLSILAALVLSAGVAQAEQWNSPEKFFNISPQIGATTASRGGIFAGAVVSEYWLMTDDLYLGVGAGGFAQGNETVGETLLKGGFNGVLGASVGASFSESDGITPTNDLWFNCLFAGLRWRMDHRKAETIHSVALFVPLGMWIKEWRGAVKLLTEP
ncbi:MAG: hypothetical protein IPK50_00195 [Fibrobacterota bacterium]|nr:hypothetical protein [Fibrobacterota bacterium]QQS05340.1 MAG: hypothetical protein IPK50_00195 [Fibrobacterota bacterium]